MDGAANTNTEARLIALDITDAAYRLWGELYDELMCSGDEYGRGPSCKTAWNLYLERGAHNYAWFNADDSFNDAGLAAIERFEAAFEDGAGIYGMRLSG